MQLIRLIHRREVSDHPVATRAFIATCLARLSDAAIAGILLILTLPLMLVIALAIRLETPGPAFERQTVIEHDRRFRRWQFRTALHDPNQSVPLWARRPTQIGRLLWITRIDTLPQLFNVLRGEMTFFGNRSRLLG